MPDKQQQAGGSAATMQHIGSLFAAAAATAAAGAAAAWYWRSLQRPLHSAQRSASAPAEVAGIDQSSRNQTSVDEAGLRQHGKDVAGTTTPPLRADLAAKLATDSTSWGDSSWRATGAMPCDIRAISAQAALQTGDATGGGWGNVFSRKSHRLDSSSDNSPGAQFDSPQLPWWNGGSGGSGGGGATVSNAAQRVMSASSEDIDGTAKIAELQLYHNEDGQPALLGRGGFGQVFKAKFRGEDVAVKVFVITDQDRSEAKFRQEIELLKACSHGNVVGFRAACLDAPGHLMLVMELLDGGDLRSALEGDTKGRLLWHKRGVGDGAKWQPGLGKAIALDVARGLAFLHQRHIVHLDLKSPNVLLTADGRAKVGDVGLARFMAADYMSAQAALGTFSWTAPEVLMGGKCGAKVDVFSFGVILWEIVTGEAPNRGRMRAVRVPAECPQGVADLITACMSELPADRLTAAEVAALLAGDAEELEARRIKPFRVGSEAEYAPVHVTQQDKEACVQRYDDAFTFFHGSWDAALEAGYTSPPVETALDDVRACEVAGYDMAVKELRRRLAAADAEPPDPAAHVWIEQFSTVTTQMYYQKLRFSDRFLQTLQTKDVLETCIQQSEKAEAAKTVGGQSPDDVNWHAVLSKLQLTQRQADAFAEARKLVAREVEQLHASRVQLVARLQALTKASEDTDYEAAVEVSQSLRGSMQREARLSYKFEVWFGTELLTRVQFAHVAAMAWPVVVADGMRIGAALLAERGKTL